MGWWAWDRQLVIIRIAALMPTIMLHGLLIISWRDVARSAALSTVWSLLTVLPLIARVHTACQETVANRSRSHSAVHTGKKKKKNLRSIWIGFSPTTSGYVRMRSRSADHSQPNPVFCVWTGPTALEWLRGYRENWRSRSSELVARSSPVHITVPCLEKGGLGSTRNWVFSYW